MSSLLVSIICGAVLRTRSFDCAQQTLLWLDVNDDEDVRKAPARLEVRAQGLVLVPSEHVVVRVPGRRDALAGPVALEGRAPVLLGLVHLTTQELTSVYVRPWHASLEARVPLAVANGASLEVGSDASCALRYQNPYVSARHARLSYSNERFFVQDLGSGNGTFVNGRALDALRQRWLEPGDVVQVLDFVVVVGATFLMTNAPCELRLPATARIRRVPVRALPHVQGHAPEDEPPPRGMCSFYPAPWLVSKAPHFERSVDAPPQRVLPDDRPLAMRVGPSLFMGLSSVYLGARVASGLAAGEGLMALLPTLCMVCAMLGGTIVWPLVAGVYERTRARRRDLRRKERYVAYLDVVERELQEHAAAQTHALLTQQRPVEDVLYQAHAISPLLMSRTQDSEGFLRLRVGTGTCALEAHVAWPERHVALEDDALWDRLHLLRSHVMHLSHVPVVCDLVEHPVVGVVGEKSLAWEFLRGLMVQLCALHSYDEVRMALIADEHDRAEWESLALLAHMGVRASQRLLATTPSGVERLDRILAHDERHECVRTVMVCAQPVLAKRARVVDETLSPAGRAGFSVVLLGAHLHDLPRECAFIIDLAAPEHSELRAELLQETKDAHDFQSRARMFVRTDVMGSLQPFEPDVMVSREQMRQFALDMGRIYLATEQQGRAAPESLGFLELYEVGRVEHLNVGKRWLASDSARSLSVALGVDEEGNVMHVDLHEAADGPHALIAGTTGSGKSELIQALVLSLSVNFSPDEVTFLLIDYKGGGLAGALYNEHRKLPHVVGTITNLDGKAIGRALVSLRSELTRRQRLLGDARTTTGESSVDIHRYGALYRQGVVRVPLPHLFVVADEFAELKQQEPQFMDELISTARIGRSLGIHLVLATQKPSGVVNDQIWSNARCKISLKVSDAADSREMIRTDDAALLRQPGAFYVLVGYDERMQRAQAAYAGGAYVPHDEFVPSRDDVVELLDGEGQVVGRARPTRSAPEEKTSELVAAIDEVARVAHAWGLGARPLWLDPLSPLVTLDELECRWNAPEPNAGSFLAGEIDDPAHQRTLPLRVDLADAGNVVVYGDARSDAAGLVRAMAVSAVRHATAQDVWLYAVDLGQGSLRALAGLPHLGGTVETEDGEERLAQLMRLLECELARRRREGFDPTTDARVLVAWVQLAVLVERFADLEPQLHAILRDGPALGMHAIASAEGTAGIPMQLRTHFGLVLPTLLGEAADYAYALGSVVQELPTRVARRGLVLHNRDVLEFQGLTIGDDAQREHEAIAAFARGCVKPAQGGPAAIPELPAHVYAHSMGMQPQAASVPVGYACETVQPQYLNLAPHASALVTGNDSDALLSYVQGLCAYAAYARKGALGFFDPCHLLHGAANGTVFSSEEELGTALAGECAVLVVVDAVHALEALAPDARADLERVVCAGAAGTGPAVVFVSEAWRLATRYDDWYRAASSSAQGVWVADGFADQAIFHLPRLTKRHRRPARTTEGFVIQAGSAHAVRLLEAGEGDACTKR